MGNIKTEHISEVLDQSLNDIFTNQKNWEEANIVPTGFKDLDNTLKGFQNGELILLAGQPRMGKNIFSAQIGLNLAQKLKIKNDTSDTKEEIVIFISLDYSASMFCQNFLKIKNPLACSSLKLKPDETDSLLQTAVELQTLPIYIASTWNCTSETIAEILFALSKQKKIRLLVINYLELIQKLPNQDSNHIIWELKMLAWSFNVPILVSAQLGRKLKRKNKRPLLKDLHKLKNIALLADKIVFIYREFYYLKRNEPVKRKCETLKHFQKRYIQWNDDIIRKGKTAEIIIAKNSNKPTGTVFLSFDPQQGFFSNCPPHTDTTLSSKQP